ncbi:MAG: flagellar hook-length control protein FliK [Methylophilaceae bacterium]
MLPKSVDIGRVPAVTAVIPAASVAAIGDPREEQAHQTQQFIVGQQYQAQVISRLRDNSFMVDIGGVTANAMFAAAAKPGQTLTLTFVGATPKPSFAITLPADTGSGVKTHLSPSAVLINQYWDIAQQKGAPPAFQTAAVIAQSPYTAPAAMAANLKASLVQSGLFYESHLVNFFLGKQSSASLLSEPQNQARPPALPAPAMAPQAQLPSVIHTYAQLANSLEAHAVLPPPATTAFTAPASLPAAISALVPVQLGILEHQGVVWQGQIWPGQEMQWEIRRPTPQHTELANDASSQEQDAADMSAIHSQLILHLPRLGKIVAQLQMQHGNISLKIDAENSSTAAALKQQSWHLIENLENAGQPLNAFAVAQHDATV